MQWHFDVSPFLLAILVGVFRGVYHLGQIVKSHHAIEAKVGIHERRFDAIEERVRKHGSLLNKILAYLRRKSVPRQKTDLPPAGSGETC